MSSEFIKAHSDRYKSWEPYTGPIPVHFGIFQLSALAAFTLLAIVSLGTLGMRIYRHYYDDDHDGSGQIDMTTNVRNTPGYVAVSMIPTPIYQTSLQQQESLHDHHAKEEEEEVKIELNAEIGNREKRNRNKKGNSVVVPSSYQNLRSSKNTHRGVSHDGVDQYGNSNNGESLNYGSTQAINPRIFSTTSNKEQKTSMLSSLWFLPSLRKIAMDKVNGLLSRTTGVESIHSKVSSTYAASSSSDINMTTSTDTDRRSTRNGVRETLSSESNNHAIGL